MLPPSDRGGRPGPRGSSTPGRGGISHRPGPRGSTTPGRGGISLPSTTSSGPLRGSAVSARGHSTPSSSVRCEVVRNCNILTALSYCIIPSVVISLNVPISLFRPGSTRSGWRDAPHGSTTSGVGDVAPPPCGSAASASGRGTLGMSARGPQRGTTAPGGGTGILSTSARYVC